MDNKFEKTLRDKLLQHGMPPPPGVWERIERDIRPLAAKPATALRRNTLLRVAGYAAAACILASALILGVLRQPESPAPGQQVAALVPVKVQGVAVTAGPAVEDYAAPVKAAKAIAAAMPAKEVTVGTVAKAEPVTVAAVDNGTEPADGTKAISEQPERGTQLMSSAATATENYSTTSGTQGVQDAWMAWSHNLVKKKAGRRKLSGALYAANFGGGRSSGSNSSDMLYKGGYMIKEVVTRAGDVNNAVANIPDVKSANHRIPLSFGGEVSFDISPRVSLETGLTYTYLRSDITAQGQLADYKIKQELHYLGVPVSVSYDFVRARSIDAYVRAGGMLEKGISGTRKTSVSSSNSGDETSVKMKGLQPSIFASAGLELKLGRKVGLYFEPGVAYYPVQEDQPDSYRTENPFTINLKAGIRVNLLSN